MLALPRNLAYTSPDHIVSALQAHQSDVAAEQTQPPPSDTACDPTANLMRVAKMSSGMRF